MKHMKLYTIRAYNRHGGCGGTYQVVATGVNLAKAALRESVDWIRKLEVVRVEHGLIIADEPESNAGAICEYRGLPAVEAYKKD